MAKLRRQSAVAVNSPAIAIGIACADGGDTGRETIARKEFEAGEKQKDTAIY
jgi:hypothetical protein